MFHGRNCAPHKRSPRGKSFHPPACYTLPGTAAHDKSAMAEYVTNDLLLEHLKAIRADLSDIREQNRNILKRLANLETMVARQGRD